MTRSLKIVAWLWIVVVVAFSFFSEEVAENFLSDSAKWTLW